MIVFQILEAALRSKMNLRIAIGIIYKYFEFENTRENISLSFRTSQKSSFLMQIRRC